MTVELVPLTRRGRNRTVIHGTTWAVMDRQDAVLFSDAPGPWLRVEPAPSPGSPGPARRYTMWVREAGDPDYRVIAPGDPA